MARALWKGAISFGLVSIPMVPSKGGERAYSLLREAIRESDRVGIAKFILRAAKPKRAAAKGKKKRAA
jgi:non-homologous end joining protein Ku